MTEQDAAATVTREFSYKLIAMVYPAIVNSLGSNYEFLDNILSGSTLVIVSRN